MMDLTDNIYRQNVIFNVRCPHCNAALRAEVSGFARSGLNSRYKTCPKCHKDYSVVFYAETSPCVDETDGLLNHLKWSIKQAKKQRSQLKRDLDSQLYVELNKDRMN